MLEGYLAECFVDAIPQYNLPLFTQAPINQTEPLANPLPADDPQLGWVPARPVPFAAINSQWDYPAARGFALPDCFITQSRKAVFCGPGRLPSRLGVAVSCTVTPAPPTC